MKNKKIITIVTICVLGFLLTSCSGNPIDTWGGGIIADSVVYYSYGSQVQAIKVGDGTPHEIWPPYPEIVSASRVFYAAPVLIKESGQLLLADYGGTLTSIDINTGIEMGGDWPFVQTKGSYIDSPLVVGDTIIAPNADGYLYSMDLNGNPGWTFPIKGDDIPKKGAFWAQPVSDGTYVYASSMDHHLYAVDLATGIEVWNVDLKASLVGRPTIEDGVIYIGNLEGDFFAVDTEYGLNEDARILWTVKLDGGVWAAPILIEGKLFFGDQSGNINILNAADGSVYATPILTESPIVGSGVRVPGGIVFANEYKDEKNKDKSELIKVGFDGKEIGNRTTVDGSVFSNLSTDYDATLVANSDTASSTASYSIIVIVYKGDYSLLVYDAEFKENSELTPIGRYPTKK